MNPPVMIVGGAGYIGSHMVRNLLDRGLHPVVLDDLSSGHLQAIGNAEFIRGSIHDSALLDNVFSSRKFECVMHFASFIQVGESVSEPGKYYDNNLGGTITLLNAMARHQVANFIFSSTAAIFGDPDYTPIDEAHPARPVNPYGRSKWMVEALLEDYRQAYGLRYGCLRYFNAAGAMPDGSLGECHEPETHLIPLVLETALKKRPHIAIFGDDYPTPDGTCVRDYIHVCDLAEAHYLLWQALQGGAQAMRFNLGTGKGYSVKEVIAMAEHVTGHHVPQIIHPRRPGDPAVLVADGAAARSALGWKPVLSDLEIILRHAWNWASPNQHKD